MSYLNKDGLTYLWGKITNKLSGYVKTSDMADKYGIETGTVPTIQSKVEENRVTLGYSGKNLLNLPSTITGTKLIEIGINPNIHAGNYIISVDKLETDETNPQETILIQFFTKNGNIKYFESFRKKSEHQEFKISFNEDITSCRIFASNGFTPSEGKNFTCTNLMLRPASITDPTYEPYKPSVDERLNEVSIVETVSKSCNGTSAGEKYITLYRMKKNNTSGHHSVSFILSDWGNTGKTQTGKAATGIWICQISNIGNSAHFNVKNLIPIPADANPCEFGWYADDDYFYFAVKQPGWNGYSIITRLTPKTQMHTDVVELMTKTTTQPTGWTKVTEL